MPFRWYERQHAIDAGHKGGLSRSESKQAAARDNGRLGGRPRKQEMEPPLLALMRTSNTPSKLAPVDPRAGRAPLAVLNPNREFVTVVAGARVDEEQDARSWE